MATEKKEEVINAVSVEPEDLLEGHDDASVLRISIMDGDKVLWVGNGLPWGKLEILVEELY